MSEVPKGERNTSDIKFLDCALDLQKHTIKKCKRYPKSYRFFLAIPTADIARRIHENAKLGNSIYATNAHEAQLRLDYFLIAKAEVYNLISQIELASDIFSESSVDESFIIDSKSATYWKGLARTELNLLKGLIKSERERMKRYKS
jgi:hypothetical protein